MPYEWIEPANQDRDATPPVAELHCWPYRSLPRRDMVLFIGATATLVALPLLTVIGSPVLWGLLPFFLLMLAAVWYALERSYRDGEILEELRLTPDEISIDRHNPRGPDQHWQANPYWVQVALDEKDGPVENYVTLSGNGREVELGAFLTPEERANLYGELRDRLSAARQ
ncbi:DUF2244 domain-containing protein [Aestuariibius sp. 2305UL40-4]|uniref:DUF2244 domain-containing protein n=1 Tax=Aestuariibius violaceus TaxID=3234132 RepID=UPI00398F7BE1